MVIFYLWGVKNLWLRACVPYYASMPKKREISEHPRRKEIEEAILRGDSFSKIQQAFNLSYFALYRYATVDMKQDIVVARQQQQEETQDLAKNTLLDMLGSCKRLHDACDEWLRDPDAPQKYTLVPRATEVKCVYLESTEDGDRRQVKTDLQTLLDKTQVKVNYTVAQIDNRKLMLDVVNTTGKQLETLGRYMGILDKGITAHVQLDGSATAGKVAAVILDELADYPELAQRIVRRLENGD